MRVEKEFIAVKFRQADRGDRTGVAQYSLAVTAARQLHCVFDKLLIVAVTGKHVFIEPMREVLAKLRRTKDSAVLDPAPSVTTFWLQPHNG